LSIAIVLIQIIPVRIAADIKPGDDLAKMIVHAAEKTGIAILDGDVVVVAQKIVSKAEGRIVNLGDIKPSRKAKELALANHKDPRLVELTMRESRRIIRARKGVIITETNHGFVCANSGIDQSNVRGDSNVVLLPLDPDESALGLKKTVEKFSDKRIAVIITDTFGRPFRNGQTNVAIGVAGMKALRSYVGSLDMYGKKLRVTEIAVADEIASAAELAMGKANRIPVAIVRGCAIESAKSSGVKSLLREKKSDLFR
jgi:coenzyme F420-0:L-glutamate ligase/coenzyme F420-1:gamma-L-glutamate ligase